MPGSPPQGRFKGKAGSEEVPAAAQGEEQGACPGELGSASLGTTDISKPQHWGAGEEAGVIFSSKRLFPSKAARRIVARDGARLVLRQINKKKTKKQTKKKAEGEAKRQWKTALLPCRAQS